MDNGALVRIFSSIAASGTVTGVTMKLLTDSTTLAFRLGAVVSALVAFVICWGCAQESIRTFVVHRAETIKAREESHAVRRLTKAATRGPDKKAADARAKRRDASQAMETLARTKLEDAMRITRDIGPDGPCASSSRTKAANVTDIGDRRPTAPDSDRKY